MSADRCSDSQRRQQHGSSGADEITCKVLSSRVPKQLQTPNSNRPYGAKATRGHSGFRAGKSLFLYGKHEVYCWLRGGKQKSLVKITEGQAYTVLEATQTELTEAESVVEESMWKGVRCRAAVAARDLLLRGGLGFSQAKIRNSPPCNRYPFSKGRSLGKWRLKH